MRFGIDLGGTKTEIVALAPGGVERWRKRVATVRNYDGTVKSLAELVREGETQVGAGTVGIAIPGCETPRPDQECEFHLADRQSPAPRPGSRAGPPGAAGQ